MAIRIADALSRVPFWLGRPRGNAPYIAQLDGLRALAILLVMVWHSSLRASRLHASNEAFPNFVPHGEIGVLLFFFVSGFVIAQPFLRPQTRFDAASITSFYYRRIRRIAPPYLLCLLGCFVVLGFLGYQPAEAPSFYQAGISLRDSLVASALFIHGLLYDAPSRLNPPLWSLEIEIQFYLLSPLILFLYLRARSAPARRVIGLLVLGLAILMAGLLSIVGHHDGRGRFGLPMHFYLFFLGIFVADQVQHRNWSDRTAHLGYDLLTAFGVTVLIAGGFALDPVDGHAVAIPEIAIQLLFCVAIVALYVGTMRGVVSRVVFGAPWVSLIGAMCYSIYLVHGPLMQAITQLVLARLPLSSDWVKWPVAYILLIPSALAAGAVYFRFVERPFMKSRPSRPRPGADAIPLQPSGR